MATLPSSPNGQQTLQNVVRANQTPTEDYGRWVDRSKYDINQQLGQWGFIPTGASDVMPFGSATSEGEPFGAGTSTRGRLNEDFQVNKQRMEANNVERSRNLNFRQAGQGLVGSPILGRAQKLSRLTADNQLTDLVLQKTRSDFDVRKRADDLLERYKLSNKEQVVQRDQRSGLLQGGVL